MVCSFALLVDVVTITPLGGSVNRCYILLRLLDVLGDNAGRAVHTIVHVDDTALHEVPAEVAAVVEVVLVFHSLVNLFRKDVVFSGIDADGQFHVTPIGVSQGFLGRDALLLLMLLL